jgi:uncharacterized protein YggE
VKKALTLIAIVATNICGSPKDLPSFPFLCVDVYVEADFKPDYSIMSFGVFSKSISPRAAFDTIESASRAMLGALAIYGIGTKDIIAHDISKDNSDRYNSGKHPVICVLVIV